METTPIRQQIFDVLEAMRYETDTPELANYSDRLAMLADQTERPLSEYIEEFEEDNIY